MDWKQLYEALEGAARVSGLHQKFGYVNTIETLVNLTDKTHMILNDLQVEEVKELEKEEVLELIYQDLSDLVYPDDPEFIEKYKEKVGEALRLLGYEVEFDGFAIKRLKVCEFDKETDHTAYELSKKAMKKYLTREITYPSEFKLQVEIAKALYKVYELAKSRCLVDYNPRNPKHLRFKAPIFELQRKLYNSRLGMILDEISDELLKQISRKNERKIRAYRLFIPHL